MTNPGQQLNGNTDDATKLYKEALDYAWKWFQYHAAQRMQAFNFLLILIGALSVGYYTAYNSGDYYQAFVVSCFGVIAVFAFLLLELRNEELVNVGRDALKSLEHHSDFERLPRECRLLTKDRKRSFVKSHKLWLRVIEFLLLVVFIAAAITSLQKATATQRDLTQKGVAKTMPYIKQERRQAIQSGAEPQDAGELNFAITIVVDKYLQNKGGLRYAHINEVVGAMECAKLELYRRIAVPYEDQKIKESGDVYKSSASDSSLPANTR